MERKQNLDFEKRYDAIVTIYHIRCIDGVEIPLASAKLYSEDAQDRHSSLKFQVTGDDDSRLEQVDCEVERALQVLRFICPWYEDDSKSINSARSVSMWPHSARNIVFRPISATIDSIPRCVGKPKVQSETQLLHMPFFPALLHHAKISCSLDEINHHFRNSDHNPVSRRFCRAFEFYDIASRSTDVAVALANFVISVDILLPSKNPKAKRLTESLSSLIRQADRYEGLLTRAEGYPDTSLTRWAESVNLTMSDYKGFYVMRDKVLHGNTMSESFSHEQVKKARQIAKNAIIAYARLSHSLDWQSDNEAKKWFKEAESA